MLSYRASWYTATCVLPTICLHSHTLYPGLGSCNALLAAILCFAQPLPTRVLGAFQNKPCHHGRDRMGIALTCHLSSHLQQC